MHLGEEWVKPKSSRRTRPLRGGRAALGADKRGGPQRGCADPSPRRSGVATGSRGVFNGAEETKRRHGPGATGARSGAPAARAGGASRGATREEGRRAGETQAAGAAQLSQVGPRKQGKVAAKGARRQASRGLEAPEETGLGVLRGATGGRQVQGRRAPRAGARDAPGGCQDGDQKGQVQPAEGRARRRGAAAPAGGRRQARVRGSPSPKKRCRGPDSGLEAAAARRWGWGGGRCRAPRCGMPRCRAGGDRSPVSSGQGRGGDGTAGRPGRAGRGAAGARSPGRSGAATAAAAGARRRLLLGWPAGRSVSERRGLRESAAKLRPVRGDNAALSGRKQPPRAASADAAPA